MNPARKAKRPHAAPEIEFKQCRPYVCGGCGRVASINPCVHCKAVAAAASPAKSPDW